MSKDDIIDFVEDHRGLVIAVVIIAILFCICLGIRHHNLSKKQEEPTDIADIVEPVEEVQEEVITEEPPKETYVSNVGLQEEETEEEVLDEEVSEALRKPEVTKLDVYCNVTGHTVVPTTNMDGSSCKNYQNGVSITDFDTYFGSALTADNLATDSYILIGTEQIKEGDLKSTGWLRTHLGSIDPNTAVYFTNLHVIGSLSDERVVLLCSYDWYSAYGLKDTLVVLEDISGTLKNSDFIDGDVVSTIVWAKNIKVKHVNGQDVIQIEYATEK